MTIEWSAPKDTGGCAITGYAVFMAGTEASTVEGAALRTQPGANSAVITAFSAGQAGTAFVIYLQVLTEAGDSIESEHATITLGDVPSKPPSAPTKVAAASSGSKLLIEYASLVPALNGGLSIESYSLEIDDGLGGEFVVETGLTTASLATSHLLATRIVQGRTYRVRYRAWNAYGWSPYSETAGILAAQTPDQPSAAPVIEATSDTEIQVRLDLNVGNGGSPITEWSLEINAGGQSNDVFQVISTSGLPLQTLTYGPDLVKGTIYKLRYRAKNECGCG